MLEFNLFGSGCFGEAGYGRWCAVCRCLCVCVVVVVFVCWWRPWCRNKEVSLIPLIPGEEMDVLC